MCCCRTRKREGRRYTAHPFARTHTHRQTASSCRLLKGERDTTTSDARQRRKFMTTTLPMPTPMGPGLLLEQTGLYSSNAKKKFEGGEGASPSEEGGACAHRPHNAFHTRTHHRNSRHIPQLAWARDPQRMGGSSLHTTRFQASYTHTHWHTDTPTMIGEGAPATHS